ncbi:MAG: hypothetical protein ABI114_05130 [Rhodanobacter sp.]
MTKYAQATTVSSEKSRAEIESTLRRYGATSFMYGTTADRAIVAFEANARRIKFDLPMPDPKAREFMYTPAVRKHRSPAQQEQAYEQAVRQKWRALALCIKAKLEAVDAGITTFESEFLAHIVLPNGCTVAESALPAIADAYNGKSMPPLLGYSP